MSHVYSAEVASVIAYQQVELNITAKDIINAQGYDKAAATFGADEALFWSLSPCDVSIVYCPESTFKIYMCF